MADRYSNLNGTAPETDPAKQKSVKVPKSDFNLSCAKYFKTIDGLIVPFHCIHVLPNSSHDLGVQIRAIMTNPYVKQLLTGKRGYVHAYHSNWSDIWEGATELIKKGRSFNVELEFPHFNKVLKKGNKEYTTHVAGAPSSYLGLPVYKYDTSKSPLENIKPIALDNANAKTINNYDNFEHNALQLAMFQQIYQSAFLNKNLVNNNTAWLPQVENHFVLPLEVSGKAVAQLSYDADQAQVNEVADDETFEFNSDYFVPTDKAPDAEISKSNKPFLNAPRFRQFKGDMFVSGSPFADLMRGDTPVMSFADLTGSINWDNVIAANGSPFSAAKGLLISNADTIGIGNPGGSGSTQYATNLKTALDKAVVNVQNQLQFNLNSLRALDVYTLLGERAARTDGTYNSFIEAMFGVNPKMHSHEPRYLGGFYLDFVNNTIEQTSETGDTPLGTAVSRGVSNGNGHIGKFTFFDHGYIMFVLSIVDETVYTNGVSRDWTSLTFDEQYLPQFNNLAPQATLQQELFLTGNKAQNEEPFNFVERFSHLKSEQNHAVGQMSLPAYLKDGTPIDLESAAFIHSRKFFDKVEFNNKFVTMSIDNLDMSPYVSAEDYPYLVTALIQDEAVAPLPYITVPAGLTIIGA